MTKDHVYFHHYKYHTYFRFVLAHLFPYSKLMIKAKGPAGNQNPSIHLMFGEFSFSPRFDQMSTCQLSFSDTFAYVLGTTALNRFKPAKIIGGQPMAVVCWVRYCPNHPNPINLLTVHGSEPAGRAIECISSEGYERSVLFLDLTSHTSQITSTSGWFPFLKSRFEGDFYQGSV